MSNMIKLKSNRTGESYNAVVYQKNDALIVRHASLQNIYQSLPDEERPAITPQIPDLRNLPEIPPMYVVSVVLEHNGVRIEQFGEMLCSDWQTSNAISRSNPLAICYNRAFDKCFLRYMRFDVSAFEVISIYSDTEINVEADAIPLTGKTIASSKEKENSSPVVQAPVQANQTDLAEPVKKEPLPGILPETPDSGQLSFPDTIYPETVPEFFGEFPNTVQEEILPDEISDIFTTPDSFPEETERPAFPWDTPGIQEQSTDAGQGYRGLVVTNVYFDKRQIKSVVETNRGTFLYSPGNNLWESPSVDIHMVDLNELYSLASNYIRCDLCRFGFIDA